MIDLKVRFPGHIISANDIYKRGRNGQIFYAPEARQYRQAALPIMQAAAKKAGVYEGGVLVFTAYAYDQFYNKDGSIKSVDIDNSLKILVDSVFKPFDARAKPVLILGVDDKAIFDVLIHKRHCGKAPYCRVTVKELPR